MMKKIKSQDISCIKTVVFASIFSVLSILIISVSPQTVQAAPFVCEVGFYQAVDGDLKVMNPQTGAYTTLPNNTTASVNAIGYNTEDDYIYGLSGASGTVGHVIRFEHDGTRTDLGLPTGLPASTFVAGDFDSSGNLWVKSFGSGATIYRIDISTLTATSLNISSAINISELVFNNGYLYAVNGGTALLSINITTGTVNSVTITNGVAGNYGAGWATVANDIYFSNNMSGVIYRIDGHTTNTPVAVPVLQGEITTGNDGAACPLAESPIVELIVEDDAATISAGETLQVSALQGVLSNDSYDDGATISGYTQPSNGTVVVQADGSYTYTPNSGFSGLDNFTYTITDSLGNEATATVTITVQPVEIPIPGAPAAGTQNPLLSVVSGAVILGIVSMIGFQLKQRFHAR